MCTAPSATVYCADITVEIATAEPDPTSFGETAKKYRPDSEEISAQTAKKYRPRQRRNIGEAARPKGRHRANTPAKPSVATQNQLPAIVSESLVGLGHSMRVFLLLDRVALALGGGNNLGRKLLGHGLLRPIAREGDQPPHGERRPPIWPDLDGDLIGRAANTPALDLDDGLEVREGLLEDVDARLVR